MKILLKIATGVYIITSYIPTPYITAQLSKEPEPKQKADEREKPDS